MRNEFDNPALNIAGFSSISFIKSPLLVHDLLCCIIVRDNKIFKKKEVNHVNIFPYIFCLMFCLANVCKILNAFVYSLYLNDICSILSHICIS